MGRTGNCEAADRIFAAAAEVFAEKGFRGATTREIAKRAGANIASLHYHFQDKETLYLKVLDKFIDGTLEESPIPEGIIDGGLPPERCLEIFVDTVLRRALDRKMALAWRLFLHEMIDPSSGRDLMAERLARPHSMILRGVVGRLLGEAATEERLRLCCISVASQILYHRIARPMIDALMPGQDYVSEEAVAKLSSHISRFSIAAIKAERDFAHA